MENPFLVKCIDYGDYTKQLTEGKLYLATEHSKNPILLKILINDMGKKGGYFKRRFYKLSFVDIWELKRKNEWLTNQSE